MPEVGCVCHDPRWQFRQADHWLPPLHGTSPAQIDQARQGANVQVLWRPLHAMGNFRRGRHDQSSDANRSP